MRFGSGDPRTYTGLSATFLIFVDATSGATIAPPSITESLTGSGLYQFQWGTTNPIVFLVDAATTSPGVAGRYVTGELDPSDRSNEYGTTIVAIGTTTIALGTTSVALGTTSVGLGIAAVAVGNSSMAGINNMGSSLVGIGNTSIAYGGTILADIVLMGSTLVAIGNTVAAIGSSLSFVIPEIGSTASLIGNLTTDPVDLFGYVKRIAELVQGQETFQKGTGALAMYDRTGATQLAARTVSNNSSMVIKS